MSIYDELLGDIPIPPVFRISQSFPRNSIADVEKELIQKLKEGRFLNKIKKDWRVAITAGSRGISNQPLIVKRLVQEIKNVGGDPFIVAAMGSHGGATAEGQKELLLRMGFLQQYIQAPVHSCMETVVVGKTDRGLPVYIDKHAFEADAIVVLNRIKPHVSFRGRFESGLMKMIAIGLGKQKGAEACHAMGFDSMGENIESVAYIGLQQCNIIFGIGLLENAYHETCAIEIMEPEEIPIREVKLLSRAKALLPRLYFDTLDVLIIDEFGKNISGTGMDNNLVGRYTTSSPTGGPKITRIVVLSLTSETHGNANGLGIVDFITKRVLDAFDFEQTYPNALTSTAAASVKIPMVLQNDRLAIQSAVKTCNRLDVGKVTLVRIKNTLQLDEIEVSANLLPLVKQNQNMDVIDGPYALKFDERGNLF